MAGSASAQFGGHVRVSNVIEGGRGSVSAARCGNGVVVGFGDVESGRPNSQDGFAFSKDDGKTFTDGGTLPVASSNDFVGSNIAGPNDPVNLSVACSTPSRFYYASAGSVGNPPPPSMGFLPNTTVSVSTSTDGGAHWGLPLAIDSRPSDTEILLAPSIAVDPTDPSRFYVAYLHEFPDGPIFLPDSSCGIPAYTVEIAVVSGKQISSSLIDYACFQAASAEHSGTLGAPNVIVSPGGKVYIAYEFMGQNYSGQPTQNEIRFTRSLNQGGTFSTPMTVSTDAIINAPLQLAVDRTSARSRGAVYLSWPGSPSGTYTDVLVSDSLNFGVSFSFPRPISPAPAARTGRFQTSPVIAVDNDGQVVDCFYATPTNRPTTSSVYSYNCATSFSHAATWTVQDLISSVPVGFDAITSDFLLHYDGFFTGFELTSNRTKYVIGEASDH